MLFWLHVGVGQLLCLHDFLSSVRLPGAGGKDPVLGSVKCRTRIRVCALMDINVCAFV